MSKFLFASLLVSPCAAELGSGAALVNDAEYIERLNAAPDSSWVADHQEVFKDLTVEAARMRLGAKLSHISEHLNSTLPDTFYAGVAANDVPTDFDSRTRWPGLIHPIRNQEMCGSCWAFSASEVLSDRVAIAEGRPSPVLSAEDLVSCDTGDHGCSGGYLDRAWKYITDHGLVTDTCFPYTAGGGRASSCIDKCVDSEPLVRTVATRAYAIHGADNMQKDIMTYGPIQVGFMVYRSFMSYRSGVYHTLKSDKSPEGGHAVKLVGWGVTTKKFKRDYWTVANSWGPTWGLDGFFKIRRGVDMCSIETMGPPYAGLSPVASEVIVV